MLPESTWGLMRDVKDRVAIVTGASGGVGPYIARALADAGAWVALAARSGDALEGLRSELEESGARAVAITVDLAERGAAEVLVREVERALGPVDVLVNNAAIETVAAFEERSLDEIERTVAVNLIAPLALARLVLPSMLARNQGHIVNIASLAGLSGNAYSEVYAATKHGLVGFTRSLRATAAAAGGSAVGATVVCPGFIVEAGMWERMRTKHQLEQPALLGVSRPDDVVRAVMKAIHTDRADIIVDSATTRLLLALSVLFPRLMERLALWSGAHTVFQRIAELEGTGRKIRHQ